MQNSSLCLPNVQRYRHTAELHSGLSGTATHPDMHKIRIIQFFSLNQGYSASLNFSCYYLQYVPTSMGTAVG